MDTHAFIGWDAVLERLGPQGRAACFCPANALVLSVASVWEMQIKLMLGKLSLRKPLRNLIADQVAPNGPMVLEVTLETILRLGTLPFHH